MNKPKHITEPLSVLMHGGNYPTVVKDDGLSVPGPVARIEWQGTREKTIATALLFSRSPAMFEVLRRLLEWEKEAWENDDDINGGDAVDFVAQLRVEAH